MASPSPLSVLLPSVLFSLCPVVSILVVKKVSQSSHVYYQTVVTVNDDRDDAVY